MYGNELPVMLLLLAVPQDLVLIKLAAEGEVLKSRQGTSIPLSEVAKPCCHCPKQ
jgi:hypothetical protein